MPSVLYVGGKYLPFWKEADGKFYSTHSLGPFDTLYDLYVAACRLLGDDGSTPRPRAVTEDGPSAQTLSQTRRAIRRLTALPAPEKLQQPSPPSENAVAHVVESASALTLQEQDVSNVKSCTIEGSSSTSPSRCEELLDTTPLGMSNVATPPTEPHNMTNVSPPSASSLGSPIFARDPPRWYLTFYIRMDRGGLFHTYPKMNGPFQSLEEAEAAIDHHLDELRQASGLKQRHELSAMDWMIQQACFYPDGMPRKGPNSPARKNPNHHQRRLIQVLLDQYNEDHNLFEDDAHELRDLLAFQYILEDQMSYYHFNFTTKTKKGDDDNMFFAEVSRMLEADNWVVSCCCIIKNNDNGHCNGCINNGSPELRHPQKNSSFAGGHLNGYLPFGGDTCTDSDDEDMEDYVARLKIKFGN